MEDFRPRDLSTRKPIGGLKQPGYYPGFSTLAQRKSWDDATRDLILKRVAEVPKIRFFSLGEAAILQAALDQVLPQDDRAPEYRIPILNFIDARLYTGTSDGYVFEGMPEDGDAHLLGLQALEKISEEVHRAAFTLISRRDRDLILQSIRDGEPLGTRAIWRKMRPFHYWTLLVQDAAAAYYSHPWAWDEIGFGGPAYPRGYMRLDGTPEPWEKREKRYDWGPPLGSVSDEYRPLQGTVASKEVLPKKEIR